MPRFDDVSCSQCGQSFGPGDCGYSHCEDHRREDEGMLAAMYAVISNLDPTRRKRLTGELDRRLHR